jgi:hypothetical protein
MKIRSRKRIKSKRKRRSRMVPTIPNEYDPCDPAS